MSKIDLSKYQNAVEFNDNPIDYERFTMVVYNTDNDSVLASCLVTPDEHGANDVDDLMKDLSIELLGVETANISSVKNIVSSFFSYRFPDDYMMTAQFIMTSKDWIVRNHKKHNTDTIPENIHVVFNHICGNKAYVAAKDKHLLHEKSIGKKFIADVKASYGFNSKIFSYITSSLPKNLTGIQYMEAVVKEAERFESATAYTDPDGNSH